MNDALDDDIDLPMYPKSEEQLRLELLEAREDIRAGRIVSGESVLAKLDRMIENHLSQTSCKDDNAFSKG